MHVRTHTHTSSVRAQRDARATRSPRVVPPQALHPRSSHSSHPSPTRTRTITHLGERGTSTRVVDDIRHQTLHIAVAFGVILHVRRKAQHRQSSHRRRRIRVSRAPTSNRCARRPRVHHPSTPANDAHLNQPHLFTRARAPSAPAPPPRARPARTQRHPRDWMRSRAHTRVRRIRTHLLAMLRRAFTRVRVGGKHRPFTFTATSDNATHCS